LVRLCHHRRRRMTRRQWHLTCLQGRLDHQHSHALGAKVASSG
jgi:hypothetical protein